MAWLKFLESAGNHLLAYDPDFLEQLQPFFGRTFRIELTEPAYEFELRPCPDGFIVEPAGDETADVSLRGSLWAFSRLAKEGAHSDVFAQGKISMRGDAELGQAFQQVLAQMQIDWEELLSSLLGDAAARGINRALNELGSWFDQSSRYFSENSGDFLREELQLTPSRLEVESLEEQIETLRADTARLEARIRLLQSKTETSEGAPNA